MNLTGMVRAVRHGIANPLWNRPAVQPLPAESQFQPNEFLGHKPATKLRTLSVLIPVFNERYTVRKLIDRVLHSGAELDLELVVVDDASTDGSWDILQQIAQEEPRLMIVRHERNQGKGAAIRTAIQHMSGDVAVIQDADLEYDPHDFNRLLAPILSGQAEAVFGSRFLGEPRRAMFFWHSVANKLLTLISNMVNDLNLTDMETCYKMVRAETLKSLRLKSSSFTIEPELTARLAQWGGAIYEVPISYSGRSYAEGKKIKALDGLKAIWEIFRAGWWDRRFTIHSGFYILTACAKANQYNRWILQKIRPFLGKRMLEAGAGIGNLSTLLLERERLVLADYEALYVSRLEQRFQHLEHLRVEQIDLTRDADLQTLETERLDTIFSSNVLEHIEHDVPVLERFHRTLTPGGHCIIVVPAGPQLYTGVDAELGHFRRYTADELQEKMTSAGFEVVHTEQFNRLGAFSWWLSGKIFGRRDLSPSQMIWFDRLLPMAKLLEYLLPWQGMSLIVVGRKPDTASAK